MNTKNLTSICSKCNHVSNAPQGTKHRHKMPKKDRAVCGGKWVSIDSVPSAEKEAALDRLIERQIGAAA